MADILAAEGGDFALRQYAAMLGSTGVGAGAFGAHYLKDTLNKKPNGLANWKMAVMYQLIHATAVLAISAYNKETKNKNLTLGGKLLSIGTLLFSGSIYGLCLDIGPKKLLGPTTPIGGLLMVGGWIVIGMGAE